MHINRPTSDIQATTQTTPPAAAAAEAPAASCFRRQTSASLYLIFLTTSTARRSSTAADTTLAILNRQTLFQPEGNNVKQHISTYVHRTSNTPPATPAAPTPKGCRRDAVPPPPTVAFYVQCTSLGVNTVQYSSTVADTTIDMRARYLKRLSRLASISFGGRRADSLGSRNSDDHLESLETVSLSMFFGEKTCAHNTVLAFLCKVYYKTPGARLLTREKLNRTPRLPTRSSVILILTLDSRGRRD